jgi:hypothetical protein
MFKTFTYQVSDHKCLEYISVHAGVSCRSRQGLSKLSHDIVYRREHLAMPWHTSIPVFQLDQILRNRFIRAFALRTCSAAGAFALKRWLWHTHHLISNAVGFLLVLVARLVDAELGLDRQRCCGQLTNGVPQG